MNKKKQKIIVLREIILVFFVFVLLLMLAIQIASRYLLKEPVFFTEEISLITYTWMIFIGMSYTERRNEHIRVDLIKKMLTPIQRNNLDFIINLISLLVFVVLFVKGINFVTFNWASKTPALRMGIGVLNFSIVVGAGLSILQKGIYFYTIISKHKENKNFNISKEA